MKQNVLEILTQNFNDNYLPSLVVTTTALIVMLSAAYKRNHAQTNLITIFGLLLTFFLQYRLIEAPSYQTVLFMFDGITSLVSTFLIVVSILISFLLYNWLERINEPKEEYYLLLLLATQGALVLCASIHFASFFLGLELLGLSLIPMVAYVSNDDKALEAGIKYLVLSAAASAFVLMAIGILYLYAGTLSLVELVEKIPAIKNGSNDVILSSAIVMLLIGIAFKLSLVPCHLWVADLFEGSPTPTAALLATLSKTAIFVVLLRMYSLGAWHTQPAIIDIIAFSAAASMLMGNLLALLQKNLFRLLAYSSIAHFGYILLAILSLNSANTLAPDATLATEAAVYYIVAYLVTVTGIFTMLMLVPNVSTIDQLRGMFWKKRSVATVLMLLLLSLAGIPLTIGFVGKFYLTVAAVNSQLWWLLATLVIGSVIGIFYYLRIILIMIDKHKEEDVAPAVIGGDSQGDGAIYLNGQFVMAIIVVMVMGIGIFPQALANAIHVLVK